MSFTNKKLTKIHLHSHELYTIKPINYPVTMTYTYNYSKYGFISTKH